MDLGAEDIATGIPLPPDAAERMTPAEAAEATKRFLDENAVERYQRLDAEDGDRERLYQRFTKAKVRIEKFHDDDTLISEQPRNLRSFSVTLDNVTGILAGLANPYRYNEHDNPISKKGKTSDAIFRQLKSHGFKKVIGLDVGAKDINQSAAKKAGIKYRFLEVEDMNAPSERGMKKIYQEVKKSFKNFEPVAIHCGEGFGRTGTVLAALMIMGKGNEIPRTPEALSTENIQVKLGHYSPALQGPQGQEIREWPTTQLVHDVIEELRQYEREQMTNKSPQGGSVEVPRQVEFLTKLHMGKLQEGQRVKIQNSRMPVLNDLQGSVIQWVESSSERWSNGGYLVKVDVPVNGLPPCIQGNPTSVFFAHELMPYGLNEGDFIEVVKKVKGFFAEGEFGIVSEINLNGKINISFGGQRNIWFSEADWEVLVKKIGILV